MSQSSKKTLTFTEKYYIEQKHTEMTIEELSVQLRIPKKLIKAEVENIQKRKEKEAAPPKESTPDEPKPPKAKDFFGRNKKYGATIMTRVSSEFSDGTRKSTLPQKVQDCIHKISEE